MRLVSFFDVPIQNGGQKRVWISMQNNVCLSYVFELSKTIFKERGNIVYFPISPYLESEERKLQLPQKVLQIVLATRAKLHLTIMSRSKAKFKDKLLSTPQSNSRTINPKLSIYILKIMYRPTLHQFQFQIILVENKLKNYFCLLLYYSLWMFND